MLEPQIIGQLGQRPRDLHCLVVFYSISACLFLWSSLVCSGCFFKLKSLGLHNTKSTWLHSIAKQTVCLFVFFLKQQNHSDEGHVIETLRESHDESKSSRALPFLVTELPCCCLCNRLEVRQPNQKMKRNFRPAGPRPVLVIV